MINGPLLTMPTWNQATELIKVLVDMAKALAWPFFWGVVLISWKKHISKLVSALTRLIPRLKSGKIAGFEFELQRPEIVTGVLEDPTEKVSGPETAWKILKFPELPDPKM